MPNKLTKDEILQRLDERNNLLPESPVFLYPETQQYVAQKAPLQFRCSYGHLWMGCFGNTIYNKRGCPTCKKRTERENKRVPFVELKKQFDRLGHNYIYDEQTYVNSTSYMEASCSRHGKFRLIPHLHLKGKQNCPICLTEKTIIKNSNRFLSRAPKIHHNKYDYTLVNYINSYTPVDIICKTHGIFKQLPQTHIRKHGCPLCTNTRGFSRKQIFWLQHIEKTENVSIQHANNIGEFQIPNTRYMADGFCKETNTIYEFHGDAFHGNPNRYKSNQHCNPFNREITAKELYQTTLVKEQSIRDGGFNLIVVWESEFDQMFPDFDATLVELEITTAAPLSYINHQIPHQLLQTLKISLIDPVFNGYKNAHNFRCDVCSSEFVNTLTSRKQAFRKYNSIGCPKCNLHLFLEQSCFQSTSE